MHPFPKCLNVINNIPSDSKHFAKLDAVRGYYQIPLDEESSKLTTFLLPSGHYRFKCAPMGLNASSDEFCRRTDEAIQVIPWISKIVDDIIIYAPDKETLLQRIRIVLQRCHDHNITIFKKKLQLGDSAPLHLVARKCCICKKMLNWQENVAFARKCCNCKKILLVVARKCCICKKFSCKCNIFLRFSCICKKISCKCSIFLPLKARFSCNCNIFLQMQHFLANATFSCKCNIFLSLNVKVLCQIYRISGHIQQGQT